MKGPDNSHRPEGKFYSSWKELLPFAQRAWGLCVQWFGIPADADWPTEIICSSRSSRCVRVRLLRRYYLLVRANFETDTIHYECYHLAHEMFHRVTSTRHFLRCNIWLEEAMAYLASLQILKRTGHENYAKTLSEFYRKDQTPVDLAYLRSVRLRRHWNQNKRYPQGFHVSAYRLGEALQATVAWEYLCTLVQSHSLEAWMETLPLESRFCVDCLLHQTDEDILTAFNALKGIEERDRPDALIRLGFAFFVLGNVPCAEMLYREAIRLRPEDPGVYDYLSYLLTTGGRYQEEVDIRFKAIELGASDAESFYNLGCSLEQAGRISEARIAWQQALERDEGEIGQQAKQALEDNSL